MRKWPVLKKYDGKHLRRIALPVGGIGTGTVSLGGRGDLRDWELMNRPAKGFVPVLDEVGPFFCLRAELADGRVVGRVLEGPLETEAYEGPSGSDAPQHGFPRFRSATFRTAYPFGQVELKDPSLPLKVTVQAYNPFIPGRSADSSLPVAVLRYVVRNPGKQPVQAAVCGTLPNFIGIDGSVLGEPRWDMTRPYAGAKDNRNAWRSGKTVQGLFLTTEGVDPKAEAWGSMALTCAAGAGVTYRTNWPQQLWGYRKRNFWEEFVPTGKLKDPGGLSNTPLASLAIQREIPAGGSAVFEFYLTWHFPNRQNWTGNSCVGNWYTTRFADAWAAAEAIVPRLPELEAATVKFVNAFCESALPEEVLEAALFNVSTLRTQTCFQTPDGLFYFWEGCHDHKGSCDGNCTHVWNYEQATAFLFGDLARSVREIEFAHATNDKGHMSFRVPLPISRLEDKSKHSFIAAADGQMGCLMKLYREWQLYGDDKWLQTLWPHAKRALAFCWTPGGWDADGDGVMEGCQHNTMDVEYYGPNPQMGFWYLGALAACERMSRHLGDVEFAERCADLRRRGLEWMDNHLFNGEFYIQEIRPALSADRIAEGLRAGMGSSDLTNPTLQLAGGCLVDQLAGQFMAHAIGLGYLGDPKKMVATLHSILKYNRREGFYEHFNHMRSYVLGDESGLLMAHYPRERPEFPFPYFSEVMTGFEYTAAVHMLYEGLTEEGLRSIRDIRRRYDGARRNPFDEAECGHHYGRAMASWGAILALTGFQYSAVEKSLTFAAADGVYFWSTGGAWGQVVINREMVELRVLQGRISLQRLTVNGRDARLIPVVLEADHPVSFTLS